MRTSVPMNTVFERDLMYADTDPDSIKLMKLLLLEFADQKNIQRDMGLDDAETIDSMESLRMKGIIQIVERTNGDLQLLITPLGSVEAFFAGLKR